MNSRNITAMMICAITLYLLPALAQFPGLPGCSDEFYRDVRDAEQMVNETKSVEPLVALQKRYTNATEQASLELSIGLDYNQRTGVVNPSNAVVYFTAALRNDLPSKTYIEVQMWRGSSLEQLNKTTEALKDYLRGLLACTYYDLPSSWPEILPPKIPLYMNSPDPEDLQRARDYNLYREHIDFQQFVLMRRYGFIEAAKRVRQDKSERDILEMLQTLSPDSGRFGRIIESLKSENKRPWP